VALGCWAVGSILPAMFIGLPTLYGGWLSVVFGLTQHAGLDENVLDHRLNSRTVYMNPVFRFLYWNMNYHVEHHMFPMVPYHALPKLHAAIRHDCPPPYHGLLQAYREIIPTLLRQRRDPEHFVRRELPGHARSAGETPAAQLAPAE
jgi:fatty acid desaturase